MVLSISYCLVSFSQLDSTIKDHSTFIKVNEDSLFTNIIIPENAKQIVLIIAGSGPTDNDGNNPLGMNENYSYNKIDTNNNSCIEISEYRFNENSSLNKPENFFSIARSIA